MEEMSLCTISLKGCGVHSAGRQIQHCNSSGESHIHNIACLSGRLSQADSMKTFRSYTRI